jgi:hypothetical protein
MALSSPSTGPPMKTDSRPLAITCPLLPRCPNTLSRCSQTWELADSCKLLCPSFQFPVKCHSLFVGIISIATDVFFRCKNFTWSSFECTVLQARVNEVLFNDH